MCNNIEEPYETREELVCKREKAVYEAIKKHIEKNGYGPSMREIVDATDIYSTSTAYKYATRLREKGLITWQLGRPGTLILVDKEKALE